MVCMKHRAPDLTKYGSTYKSKNMVGPTLMVALSPKVWFKYYNQLYFRLTRGTDGLDMTTSSILNVMCDIAVK
jgi:hypothetical protein